jgi:hypothetical protein
MKTRTSKFVVTSRLLPYPIHKINRWLYKDNTHIRNKSKKSQELDGSVILILI